MGLLSYTGDVDSNGQGCGGTYHHLPYRRRTNARRRHGRDDRRTGARDPAGRTLQRALGSSELGLAYTLPDDPLVHTCAVTFASDMTLLDSTLLTHGRAWGTGDVLGASLDHAMWFHRPFRADEWWLYDQWSPSASGARGLALGRIFTQDGTLVATVAQEGLIRPRHQAAEDELPALRQVMDARGARHAAPYNPCRRAIRGRAIRAAAGPGP